MPTNAPSFRQFAVTFVSVFSIVGTSFSQSDSTEYLFRNAEYSYMHYGIGYSPVFFQSGQVAHAVNLNIGCVFNDKVAVALDFDMWAKSLPYSITEYPYVTTYASSSLNIEPLIRPRKTFNFSFPVKIGYGSAQVYDNYPNYYQLSTHRFGIVQPGAMVWVNLLKYVSLGAGAQYRMALNGNARTFDVLSGFSGFAVVRFKFYTKEYWAKALERQKQYMEMQKK